MRNFDATTIAADLQTGNRAALSRAITLVESRRPADRVLARELLSLLPSAFAKTLRIGITGSPGAGKSTFIEQLGTQLTEEGHKLAVLAIDPSSSRTHGSILGDKTRMEVLSRNPMAYIRPSPAREELGGVAQATREAIRLCEAAGYTRIIIETVGVGQSEHAVQQLVDLMVLLVLPGSGDDLQGIKRGIVELADLVVVNKADGDRIPLARQTKSDYNLALHLAPARADGWAPRAITASSISEGGLIGFGESLLAYLEQLGTEGLRTRRSDQTKQLFTRSSDIQALHLLQEDEQLQKVHIAAQLALQAGEIDIDQALEQVRIALHKRLSGHG
ncbi:MAG: methylmalonyl Co-A mutase-associated GTPase MeaB [Saprospiraceae bacterium]